MKYPQTKEELEKLIEKYDDNVFKDNGSIDIRVTREEDRGRQSFYAANITFVKREGLVALTQAMIEVGSQEGEENCIDRVVIPVNDFLRAARIIAHDIKGD